MNLYQRTFLGRLAFIRPFGGTLIGEELAFTLYCETPEKLPERADVDKIVALLHDELSGGGDKPTEKTDQEIAAWLLDHVPSCFQVDVDTGNGILMASRSQEMEAEEVKIPDPPGSFRDGQGKLHRTF